MAETDKLQALVNGVRAIAPGLEIRIALSEANPAQCCITIAASSVILVYTDYGSLDAVLSFAISKLRTISQRTLAAVKPDGSS